jgi:flagellar biosynthesis/type III secretory pathway ATPase
VTGVRAIDGLLPIGRGQRIGIFGGSGVGKSTLLGVMSGHSSADVSVIALVGERNREVREFLEKDLGPEGLARSVVVVATSDMPALCAFVRALWPWRFPNTFATRANMCCW